MESTGRDPEELEAGADGLAAADAGEVTDERADVSAAAESDVPTEGLAAETDADVADDAHVGDAGATDEADVAGASDADVVPESDADVVLPVRPRNAPRYGAFIGAGVVAGVLLALILFFTLPSDGSSRSLTGLFYLHILVTPLTARLGGLAAALLERLSVCKSPLDTVLALGLRRANAAASVKISTSH